MITAGQTTCCVFFAPFYTFPPFLCVKHDEYCYWVSIRFDAATAARMNVWKQRENFEAIWSWTPPAPKKWMSNGNEQQSGFCHVTFHAVLDKSVRIQCKSVSRALLASPFAIERICLSFPIEIWPAGGWVWAPNYSQHFMLSFSVCLLQHCSQLIERKVVPNL